MNASDTIVALATAPGKSGVAVIRLSGPMAHSAVEALTKSPPPSARRMVLSALCDGEAVIDRALVVVFEEGSSFTGESSAELHVHGGRAVISHVLDFCVALPDIRLAEPGEFTRRALLNNRLDLLQAEGLADLIDAETEAQRKQALSMMSGGASDKAKQWREEIISLLALLEASIDFADEDDAPADVSLEVAVGLVSLKTAFDRELSGAAAAERIREGLRVAIVGGPNTGKSTLFNAIVGREAVIASPIAGTTRDVMECLCDFDGMPIILQDMAGLRDADDPVEKIGVDRAKTAAAKADLRIFLDSPDTDSVEWTDYCRNGDLFVATKSDIGQGNGEISVSAQTGHGLDELRALVGERLKPKAGASSLFSHARQIERIQVAQAALTAALAEDALELKSEYLNIAANSLDSLVGAVGVEDVLGAVFSRFCMGK